MAMPADVAKNIVLEYSVRFCVSCRVGFQTLLGQIHSADE